MVCQEKVILACLKSTSECPCTYTMYMYIQYAGMHALYIYMCMYFISKAN